MKYDMMRVFICAALVGFCGGQSVAAGLLKPMKFAPTYADLPFSVRMENERAGFEDWEPEYDANGRCLRGCAYQGMSIEDDLKAMERQTQIAVAQLNQATSQTAHPAPSAVPSTQPVTATPQCTPSNPAIAAGQIYPSGEPLTGRPTITSQYGDRIHPVTKIRTPHRGIDFSVPVGTDVFSPATGTVASVWSDNTCGRGIRITHAGGFESVYCHLNSQLVKAGDTVNAGCRIGQSGNTGRTTGAHLHYGIKHNGTYVDPNNFIGR